jgi:uncharacterized protein with ParB-like and HNH nuclease domain
VRGENLSEILGDFKPGAKTVRNIFDATNYYQIPDYQRPYDWGDEEIGQLWDDIYSAFESGDEYYFLGPVILAQTEDTSLEVVDGQQRLTTLTILFCILRDFHLKSLKGHKNELLKNQVVNAIQSMVDKKLRLTLITQAQYHIQFENEILKRVVLPKSALTKKEKQQPKYKYLNAAGILKDKLDTMVQKFGMSQVLKLVRYIFEKVVMITITCSSRVSAIKLFQTLNTRGLELSLADLTKSSLLSRLSDRQKREQFMSLWSEIEKIAEDNEESVTELLTYYGYYLLANKPRRSLYEEFEKLFKTMDPNKVVFELKKFAEFYDDVANTKSKEVYSLWYLPDNVFWKTVLIAAKEKGMTEFKELCKQLRRVYYAYWIANYTTAKTRDFSFKLIKLIKKGSALSKIQNEINEKMKEDNVVKWVKEDLEYDAYGNSWLKPLLILIEYGQTDESVIIEYSRNLHVDHILPIEWEKQNYWKRKWRKEKTDIWLNKIGNLTLLSGTKNIRASNEAFPVKKKIYKGRGKDGTTAFKISEKITKEPNWTEKEAKKRQKWLIKETRRILELDLRSAR